MQRQVKFRLLAISKKYGLLLFIEMDGSQNKVYAAESKSARKVAYSSQGNFCLKPTAYSKQYVRFGTKKIRLLSLVVIYGMRNTSYKPL